MPKVFSGKSTIKILCKHFGFTAVSQKGSHMKLQKKSGIRTITTIVPLHRELAHGTLLSALDLAEVHEEDFNNASKQ
ncbi:MAG TPA: type II toxin-antitoxin system HicA family toxin [Candidatus Paceibacterota bacterium]